MITPVELTAKQRQSRETQDRLLTAAFDEFQQHGLAGGRVDRIAEKANANKRSIYVYFGDKEQLFDSVVLQNVEAMLDTIPFDAEDLPGYAARLLDYLEEREDLMRLFAWRNLERSETSKAEEASYERKVAMVSAAQRAGHIDETMPAVHLLSCVLALVGAWTIASPALRKSAGPEADRSLRRAAIHEAVRRLTEA